MPCDTCFYFKPLPEHYLGCDGECRVEAPHFSLNSGSNWPLVRSADWCGEYKSLAQVPNATSGQMKGTK